MKKVAYEHFWIQEMLWFEYLCLSKFICWNLTSKVMVLAVGPLRCDYVMRADPPMPEVNAFIKEALERSLATFLHVRTQQEAGSLGPCWCLRTVSNKSLLSVSHPVWYFVVAPQTDQDSRICTCYFTHIYLYIWPIFRSYLFWTWVLCQMHAVYFEISHIKLPWRGFLA